MFSKKKKLLTDIAGMINYETKGVKAHKKEIAATNTFLAKLRALIEKEVPEFVEQFDQMIQPMNEAIQCEEAIAAAEERKMDDINDVSERFKVLYRISTELGDARGKLTATTEKLEKLRKALDADQLKGGQKKHKIEADINATIEAKRTAMENVEQKLQEVIAQREKYAAFKVRRLRNGYSTYGNVIAEQAQKESEALGAFITAIGEARDQVEAILDGQAPARKQEDEAASPAKGDDEYKPPQDAGYGDAPFPE